ncbi:protein kinase subdomain-containing protein PKL/CAK/Fmp29 [Coprinopsis cinerea AmutBmut pab1-1]|nr:protein kinase subdomain-containing protein PKL/CAK/Fmp29 [Coprinopsis cinerea AmutBmut pab1-1]
MKFLRERLGLVQVPRVLSWSSRAEDTPVEAEYIIMDVADGVELFSVWHQLTMHQKLRLVDQ